MLLDNFFRAAEDQSSNDGPDSEMYSERYTSPLDVVIEPVAERFSSQQDLDHEFERLFQVIDDDESGRVDFNELKNYIARESKTAGGRLQDLTEDQFEALTVQCFHASLLELILVTTALAHAFTQLALRDRIEKMKRAPCIVGTLIHSLVRTGGIRPMRQRAQAALSGLSHHAHSRTPPLHAAKNIACSSMLEGQSRH